MAKKKPDARKAPGSRKKPDSKRTQGGDRHILPRIAFHLPEALYEAFVDLAEDNKRTFTAEMLIAVEEHLRASGRWPRSETPSED